MDKDNLLLSQSMVKDLVKYQKKELCGLIFNNKWILKQLGKNTKANQLGHYFEYLCTGALAKNGKEAPKAERKKNGDIATDFKTAQQQAIFFKQLTKDYGVNILTAGEEVIADGKWIGSLDIKAQWNDLFDPDKIGFLPKDNKNPNNKVIIDLKFSGLIDDKWTEFGWDLDRLPYKEGRLIQAKHYTFLFWKEFGFIPPFFFWVFDAKKAKNCKIIYVEITELDLEQHEIFLHKAMKYLKLQLDKGFKAIPSYNNCIDCDYNQWCIHKVETPPIFTVIPN